MHYMYTRKNWQVDSLFVTWDQTANKPIKELKTDKLISSNSKICESSPEIPGVYTSKSLQEGMEWKSDGWWPNSASSAQQSLNMFEEQSITKT